MCFKSNETQTQTHDLPMSGSLLSSPHRCRFVFCAILHFLLSVGFFCKLSRKYLLLHSFIWHYFMLVICLRHDTFKLLFIWLFGFLSISHSFVRSFRSRLSAVTVDGVNEFSIHFFLVSQWCEWWMGTLPACEQVYLYLKIQCVNKYIFRKVKELNRDVELMGLSDPTIAWAQCSIITSKCIARYTQTHRLFACLPVLFGLWMSEH